MVCVYLGGSAGSRFENGVLYQLSGTRLTADGDEPTHFVESESVIFKKAGVAQYNRQRR